MTIDEALAASGLPRAEALLLLAHAGRTTRERLIAGASDALPAHVASAFEAAAARRRAGEPIAYLVGAREFYGRSFAVDARVLIPRPETELLVDYALEVIDARGAADVLDLGCGSGVIAVTVALERRATRLVATDRSADALALARVNASALGANVRFAAGDWYDAIDPSQRFDLIVSNPPYVAADDPHLAIGDLRFEPAGALTDGADGLDALRRIVAGAARHLTADGSLAVEHGYDQAGRVRALFTDAGFVAIASRRDLAGIERITVGSKPRRGSSGPRLDTVDL